MDPKPTNTAAWLPIKSSKSLQVGDAKYPSPSKGQLVVRTHAIALNPIDFSLPIIGSLAFPWINYPFVPGSDISGTVVEVGQGVQRFKAGDRVVAYARSLDKESSGAPEGAFQDYVLVRDNCCAPIPDSMDFNQASVIPLGSATAASGLFGKDYCALEYPKAHPRPNGQSFLVWGGSTSVGCNALQLAVAAGYQVVTTASPKNFGLVKGLGASHVFDYRSSTVKENIIEVLKQTNCAGAIAIGQGSAAPCIDIISAVPSATGRKFVAQASTPGGPPTKGGLAMVGFAAGVIGTNASLAVRQRLRGVSSKFILIEGLDSPIWKALYRDFFPSALAEGTFRPAPVAEIYGKGLGSIQDGLETLKNGVSAKKLVISME